MDTEIKINDNKLDTNKYKTSSTFSCLIAIIVMKEEFEIIVLKDGYILDENFTNENKEILICYRKEYNINNKIINSYILSGAQDPLYKLSPVGADIAHTLTYLGIKKYNPDLVVNIGYSGSTGYNNSLKIGDVICSESHGLYFNRECIIPAYAPLVRGVYPVPNTSCTIAKSLNYIPGIIGTSDSFVTCEGSNAIEKKITCVEMEFNAVSKVSYTLNKPIIGLKLISDISNNNKNEREDEFAYSLENLKTKLHSEFYRLIKYLSENNNFNSFLMNSNN